MRDRSRRDEQYTETSSNETLTRVPCTECERLKNKSKCPFCEGEGFIYVLPRRSEKVTNG